MEEDVNYASVVFKNSPPNAKKEEETLKSHGNETDQTSEAKDKKESANGCYRPQLVVLCLGILCVILVSAIIALCVYFTWAVNEKDKQLRQNQSALLAANHSLTRHVDNLTSANDMINQLRTESIKLNITIDNLTRARDYFNWTLVQWSLDVYCPMKGNDRVCQPCLKGWRYHSSRCYVFMDSRERVNQRSWQEARDDCRERNSDLTVIDSQEEQTFIYRSSSHSTDASNGYWIGLTSETGRWRWVDGSNLTEEYWTTPQGDGLCATCVQNTKSTFAVNCTTPMKWICEMRALEIPSGNGCC